MKSRNHAPVRGVKPWLGDEHVPATSILASCTPKVGAGSIWDSSQLQVNLICLYVKGGDLPDSPVESARSVVALAPVATYGHCRRRVGSHNLQTCLISELLARLQELELGDSYPSSTMKLRSTSVTLTICHRCFLR